MTIRKIVLQLALELIEKIPFGMIFIGDLSDFARFEVLKA
jgi:hypothetical protein